jgi:septal ring factor EnvC (AmiA/AmiB activator)
MTGRRSALLTAIALVMITMAAAFMPARASAADTSHKDKLNRIEEQLANEKRRASELADKEGSLLSELDRIERQLRSGKDELRAIDRRNEEILHDLKRIESESGVISRDIEQRGKLLRKRLRAVYRYYNEGETAALVSTGDYQKLIKDARLIGRMAHADRKLIERFKFSRKELVQRQEHLMELNRELVRSRQRADAAKRRIEDDKGRKDTLLSQIKSDRRRTQEMVRELERSSEELREMINRKTDQDDTPPPGTPFDKLAGRIPWPVSGALISKFGSQNDPRFDTPVFKNGIVIGASAGEQVKAVHNGRVVYADWFKGFGQLVIVNHGGGFHSLYAHLSEMDVKTGNSITAGQTVGKAGETGSQSGPGLYFEIRQKGRPVDPLPWLAKKGRR